MNTPEVEPRMDEITKALFNREPEPGEVIKRVWEMRYGKVSDGGFSAGQILHCGCVVEHHIDDPAITTFTLPELPPCQHGNTAYDVRLKVTAINSVGSTTAFGPSA
jgi:hypothetical protein